MADRYRIVKETFYDLERDEWGCRFWVQRYSNEFVERDDGMPSAETRGVWSDEFSDPTFDGAIRRLVCRADMPFRYVVADCIE